MRSRLRQAAAVLPGALTTYRFLRDRIDPHHNALRLAKRRSPGLLLQHSPQTEPDRYPAYFSALQAMLKTVDRPRILSFGCSTGEEVFTLRRYFPAAELTGIDINSNSITRCETELAARGGDPAIAFHCTGSLESFEDEHFNAILCMAVLRHGDLAFHWPEDCSGVLDFATVDSAVSGMARCLKPDGYLMICNSHFRFSDTAAARHFECVLWDERLKRSEDPIYGPDNRRIEGAEYREVVFRKRAGSGRRKDWACRPNMF